MEVKNTKLFVKNLFFIALVAGACWFETCTPSKLTDWQAQLYKWKLADARTDGRSMESVANDFRSVTQAELDDLTKIFNARFPGYSGHLSAIINDLLLYGSDYGIISYNDATFVVEEEDDTAADYQLGKKLIELGKLALVEPVVVLEVDENIKAIYDEASDDGRRISIYYKDGDKKCYLSADANGYLIGDADESRNTDATGSPLTKVDKSPIDLDAAFELMIFKERIGLRSKASGNRNLTLKNAIPRVTDIDNQKRFGTLLRFDSTNFGNENAAAQQIIAEPSADGYKLRAYIMHKKPNATTPEPVQEGYVKVDTTDDFCRVISAAGADWKPVTKDNATVFYIQGFSDLFRELSKARQNSNAKSKLDIYQNIIKNRSQYDFSPEHLTLFLNEIETMLLLATKDATLLKSLQDSSDAFFAMIDSLSGTQATTTSFSADEIRAVKQSSIFASQDTNKDWFDQVREEFERVTGQVPPNFEELLYPDQIANLNSRFARLTANTLQRFMTDLSVVLSDENLYKAFDEDVVILNQIISDLGKKNVYKNFKTTLTKDDNLDIWQNEILASGNLVVENGKPKNFQSFIEQNITELVKDLEDDLKVKTKNTDGSYTITETQKTKLTDAEQAFFLKKAKRLVENRNKLASNDAELLKKILELASINQVIKFAKDLRDLSNLFANVGLIQYSSKTKNYEDVLKSLENGRVEQKNAAEVLKYVGIFNDLVDNIFVATPDQVNRMKTLLARVNQTNIFTGAQTQATEMTFKENGREVKKTVKDALSKIAVELEKVLTYADLQSELSNLVAGLKDSSKISDEDLADFYNAVNYLLKSSLEKSQADQLNEWAVYVYNNISKAQLAVIGKNLEAASATLTKLSADLAKKLAEQPTYDSRLQNILAPKDNSNLTPEKNADAFIEELRWLAKNCIQGTAEERKMLVDVLEKKLIFNEPLGKKTPKSFKDEATTQSYKDFVKALTESLKQSFTASDLFADLKATNIDTPVNKTRYMSKAKTLRDAVKLLPMAELPATDPKAGEVANNLALREDIVFEFNAKKAYALKDLSGDLDLLISDLNAFGKTEKVLVFDEKASFVDNFAWVIKNFGQNGEKIDPAQAKMDEFAKNLGTTIDKQVQANEAELKQLRTILDKAQYRYTNNATYNKTWFAQKMDALAFGPGIVPTVNYLTERKDALIKPSATLDEREKGQLIFLVSSMLELMKKAQPNQSTSLEKFIETCNALKSLVITDRNDVFDSVTKQASATITALEDSLRVAPKNFASDLKNFVEGFDLLYFEKDATGKPLSDTEKARGINTLSTALEELIDNIGQALQEDIDGVMDKKENKKVGGMLGFGGVFEDINNLKLSGQLNKVLNFNDAKIEELKKKVADGPTLKNIYDVLVKISEKKDALEKRDRDLVVEHASKLGNQQNLPKYYNDGANLDLLTKTKGLLNVIAAMRLNPNFRNEAQAVMNFAVGIDTFLKGQNVSLKSLWATVSENIALLQALSLDGQTQLNELKTLLAWFKDNKSYILQSELQTILDLISNNPAVETSLLWKSAYYKKNETNASSVERILQPLRDELAKPMTFKMRAENLISYINEEKPQNGSIPYETWVKSRLGELTTDASMAFKENYSLDRLLVALRDFKKYFTTTTIATGDPRPFVIDGSKDDIADVLAIFDAAKNKIASRGDTVQKRIKEVSDLVKAATAAKTPLTTKDDKNIADKLNYLLTAVKAELSELERTKDIPSTFGAFQRYINNKRLQTGETKDTRAKFVTENIDPLTKAIQLPVSNVDRLNWFNLKIYGKANPLADDANSEDEFTTQDKETFLRIAGEVVANARQTRGADLKAIVNVLWRAYDDPVKIGADAQLEEIISALENTSTTVASVQTYATRLEDLNALLNALPTLSAAPKKVTLGANTYDLSLTLAISGNDGFIARARSLVEERAGALDIELDTLKDILQKSLNNRQLVNSKVDLQALYDQANKALTYVDILGFISKKFGLSPETGDLENSVQADKTMGTNPDLQNLMVVKFGELIEMLEAVNNTKILDIWRKVIIFAMNNELSSKADQLKQMITKIEEYKMRLDSAIFRSIPQRIEALTSEFKALPTSLSGSDKAKQATVASVEMFIDKLDLVLIKFVADAVVNDVLNEQQKVVEFLTNVVRAHPFLLRNEYAGLRTKVDKLIDRAKAGRSADDLAVRLTDMVKENVTFNSEAKMVFETVLTKLVNVRDSLANDKKKLLIDNVINFALNNQLKDDSLRKNKVSELSATLMKPTKPLFDESVAAGKYLDALVSLETDYAASPSTYTNSDWYAKIMKISSVEAVQAMYVGQPKAEQLAIVSRFESLILALTGIIKDSTSSEDQRTISRYKTLRDRLRGLKTEINKLP